MYEEVLQFHVYRFQINKVITFVQYDIEGLLNELELPSVSYLTHANHANQSSWAMLA